MQRDGQRAAAIAQRVVDWVGTSMGGAVGLACAGGLVAPGMRSRLHSLVLNDIAPQLAEAAR